MKWNLSFPIEKVSDPLTYSDRIVLLGSCFSTEIGGRLGELGFETCLNPFGTLFHPLSIASLIEGSLDESFNREHILSQNDLFFSYDANRTVFAHSETELRELLAEKRSELRKTLKTAGALFVTFGSSFVYRHLESDRLVANCHKEPQNLFGKELSETEKMFETWQKCITAVQQLNPDIRLIFTVSPVRHVKDGTVENSRSKARLIELAHRLCELFERAHYFPAYEILLDELRDYRFYADDLLHPSKEAGQYIFERFCNTWLSDETREILRSIEEIRAMRAHVSLYPGSLEEIRFQNNLAAKEARFRKEHPGIAF